MPFTFLVFVADTSDDVDELEYSDDGKACSSISSVSPFACLLMETLFACFSEKNQSKLCSLNKNGLSLSMASLYSDADIQRSRSLGACGSKIPTVGQFNKRLGFFYMNRICTKVFKVMVFAFSNKIYNIV